MRVCIETYYAHPHFFKSYANIVQMVKICYKIKIAFRDF